jgi:heat shock protein HslJ
MNRILSLTFSIVVLGVVGVVAAGCSSEPTAGVDLTDRTFTTTEYTFDGELIGAAEGSVVSVTFTENGVSVNAGCNSMFGDADLTDGVISLTNDQMATTLMACSEPLIVQDQVLNELFSSTPTWSLDGSELTITGSRMSMVLTES